MISRGERTVLSASHKRQRASKPAANGPATVESTRTCSLQVKSSLSLSFAAAFPERVK